jgi:MFS family permease
VLFSLLASTERGTGVRYYGWRIVVLAAVCLGLTAPGQTAGVSVFIDPMMADLDLSRTAVSTAYLVGTLAGAVTMPWFGTFLDRRGVRFALTVVVLAFTGMLAAMSAVVGVVTLTLGFVGIRMFGQGALGLVSTTSVAYWFDRQRGTALGVTSAFGQAILSIAPLALGFAVTGLGWRTAWLVAGGVVGTVTLLIARTGMRDRPEDVGQRVDGISATADAVDVERWGMTRDEAVRNLMFWAITGAVVTTGLIGTGLAFHQISILGEQGLTTIQAAANFVPQTVAGLIATLATGTLVDRIRPRTLLIVSMLLLTSAIVALPFVAPGWSAALYGAAVGASGGSARALEAAAFPRFFGTVHLGSIRGIVMAASVAGTAFGPILLALGHAASGSYIPVLRLALVLPLAVVLAGVVARPPHRDAADDRDVSEMGVS